MGFDRERKKSTLGNTRSPGNFREAAGCEERGALRSGGGHHTCAEPRADSGRDPCHPGASSSCSAVWFFPLSLHSSCSATVIAFYTANPLAKKKEKASPGEDEGSLAVSFCLLVSTANREVCSF